MIVGCGEALVDLVAEPVPGGGPMNVAVAAARLGAPAAFVGCVSTDEYGDLIWAHLVGNGVDVSACERSDAPTARAIVEHVPELVFRFEGEGTADTLLSVADLTPLGPGPHILHGGTLGMFRGQTAETLAELVESHAGIVSLDPNIRPLIIGDREQWDHFHARWLAGTDVYKASDEDLSWIWPTRTPDESARALLDSGIAAVIVTRGGEGLSVITRRGRFDVAASRSDVVDTVGAGDTVVAAFLTSLAELGLAGDPAALHGLAGSEWAEIGRRAVDAAAITCGRAGADPPRRHEIAW